MKSIKIKITNFPYFKIWKFSSSGISQGYVSLNFHYPAIAKQQTWMKMKFLDSHHKIDKK